MKIKANKLYLLFFKNYRKSWKLFDLNEISTLFINERIVYSICFLLENFEHF